VSALSAKFALLWKAYKGPELIAEHKFHPTRKWRFDWAMKQGRCAVEIDGGVFIRGRHSRGAGMMKDAEKGRAACDLGWRVWHFTSACVTPAAVKQTVESFRLANAHPFQSKGLAK